MAYSIAITVAVFATTSMLLTSFQCRLPKPWDVERPRHCLNLVGEACGEVTLNVTDQQQCALHVSSEVVKSVLEAANVAAAILLVYDLQVKTKIKLQAVMLFALRLM